MANLSPELLIAAQTELGECPVWDSAGNRLFFMDITERTLHTLDWTSREMVSLSLPGLGGGLVLTRDRKLVACLQSGIYLLDPDTGRFDFLTDPEPDKPDHRLNEAKCDPQGRLWVGSISTLGRFPTGCLYRIDHTGIVTRVLDEIAVPNTLVWPRGNDHVLFSDSAKKVVWRFRYDAETGDLSDREVFADCREYQGIPDGAAVDAEGCIWIAEFGGGRIRRYDPTGRILNTVSLPATQVTSCAFAGPGLRQLVVITTKRLLSDEQRAAQHSAGDLFVIEPEAPGVEPFAFA